ncbi:hypothetical protein [Streptomyces yaizuensis]|uniref:Uncharacterized protein n=1 Tax=Streptomyces yaizuensis TaxID=2989713 RepID=A0ABQ5P6K0_9ACTN|nr:hypothetical protein [Streptomyces sp. YSPA8]GLF98201.1 hypothetical protein SYYSPA8_27910 [Streptomyces sp. YSPA8]
MTKKKPQHTAQIHGTHRDGTVCPMTGAHQLSGSGRSAGRACGAHGGRRIQVTCTCGAVVPVIDRLDAVVTKAVHQALHLRDLSFRYIVDDGEGPKVLRQVHTLAV